MKRILVVDDDVRLLAIVRHVLESTGKYEVMTEDSGRRALSVAADFKPELVILDVIMPGMDGGEVADALRAQPATRGVPILFMTSLASNKEKTAQGGRQSTGRYLAKPTDPQELCRRVEELLRP